MDTDQREIRDAVIKLETKMEAMSEAMETMANGVAKLADMRYELISLKNDTTMLKSRVDKQEVSLDALFDKHRSLEQQHTKNSYVIGKIEMIWGILLVAGVNALIWYFQNL